MTTSQKPAATVPDDDGTWVGFDPPAAAQLASEPDVGGQGLRFPTLLETATLSSVRKAQVRAALFDKVEPVRVGRYILLERIGSGAMGEVYAAYDERLERRVALKLVRPGSNRTVKADELLQREAKALAQVSHPNVVQVYEADTHGGHLFIAMELVRGQTLTSWLDDIAGLSRQRRHTEILRRFIDAGRGLEAVHTAGVAHRDFKPDNVLVSDDGRVRVVDFGLARALMDCAVAPQPPHASRRREHADAVARRTTRSLAAQNALLGSQSVDGSLATAATLDLTPDLTPDLTLDLTPDLTPDLTLDLPVTPLHAAAQGSVSRPRLTAATPLTEPGMWMGTPQFMAPEQLRREVADQRSDQFSFCVALYHALHGAFPFPMKGADRLLVEAQGIATLLESMKGGIPALEHSAGVAESVRKALRRGLAFDPSQRFATMGELLAALESGVRRRGGRVAGAVLVFAVGAVAGTRCLLPLPAAPCANAGESMEGVWSAPRRTAIHDAFATSALPFADVEWHTVDQRLRGYAERWRGEAGAACRATVVDETQSEQQLDRRISCLDRASRQFEALVTELGHATPEAIQRSAEATEALPDLQACSHSENLLFGLEPPPIALRDDVASIRRELAQAQALERLGRTTDSLKIARQAHAKAAQLAYLPVRAEALAQLARSRDGDCSADTRAEVEADYFEALDLAEATRHDQLANEIWSRLVRLAIRLDAGTEQARAWWRRTDAAARRLGDSDYDRARLHDLLGRIDLKESKFDDAEHEATQALETLARVPGQPLEESRYRGLLASALAAQGRVADAIAEHERALKVASDAVDQTHPAVIRLLMNLGNALRKAGQPANARDALEKALRSMPADYRESHADAGKVHAFLSDLSITEHKLDDAELHAQKSFQIYQRAGAPETELAEAYVNLGNVELERKHFEIALEMYERAIALRRRHLGSDHQQIGFDEVRIADALLGLDRYDDAKAHVREAQRILEPGDPSQVVIQMVLGEVLLGEHQPDAAVPTLEDALARGGYADSPQNAARVKWALARALHDLRRDPGRVR